MNGHLEPGEAHAFDFCHWLDRNDLKIKVVRSIDDLGATELYVDQDKKLPAMNLSKVLLRLLQEGKFTKERTAALLTVATLLESL